MRTPGLPDFGRRRGRAFEYALVILTVAVIVALATWFLGQEITADVQVP
jgi:hypothetical protein